MSRVPIVSGMGKLGKGERESLPLAIGRKDKTTRSSAGARASGAGLAKPPYRSEFAWHGHYRSTRRADTARTAPTRRKRDRVSPRSGTRGGRNFHGPDPDSDCTFANPPRE